MLGKLILAIIIIVVVTQINDGAKVMRANIKAEQDCLRDTPPAELDKCFAMIKLNMEKE